MPEPQNAEEYMQRFAENTIITGFGIVETTMHVPCPFCAAPEFYAHTILETEQAMQREHTCRECGRSCKALIQRTPGQISFEFVQTGGPDAPDWLTPKMRRVDA